MQVWEDFLGRDKSRRNTIAIDSRDKRASALNYEEIWNLPSYTPDGVQNQADRQDSLHAYRGILASAPVVGGGVIDQWWLMP